MTLEDLIRKAIKEGRFGGLTLWPCEAGFQANRRNPDSSWSCHVNEDAVVALRAALGEKLPAPLSEMTTDKGVFG